MLNIISTSSLSGGRLGYLLCRIDSNWISAIWIWMKKWLLWVQAEIQIAWNCQVLFLIFIHKLLQKQYQKCTDFLKELDIFPSP